MKTLEFPLQDLNISESIQEFLNENIDRLHSALIFSERDSNDRVEVGEVSVTSVCIMEDGAINIEYEYEWSFFAGCKDINKSGVRHEQIQARIVRGFIVFDTIEYPESRTTADEL